MSKITFLKDGPAMVQGGCTITNTDGSTTEYENDVFVCRCGNSKNKPYCDGTHKDTGFTG
ncbi:CDGSH iron-sulfur domain-containing protein [Bacteroidota bacterium]